MKYTEFLAGFYSIFQVIPVCALYVCSVKNAKTWHDWYAMTTINEAYKISFDSQNI